MSGSLNANLEAVYHRIEAAAARVNRSGQEISLVAVTKTHPLETVINAYRAGLRHIGENRAPEGAEKVAAMSNWLKANHEEAVHWHFIGHLQSRQVADVLGSDYALIHSVDSLKLAKRINRLAKRDDFPTAKVLLQCNVSGESSKFGFNLSHWQSNADQRSAFMKEVAQIVALDKIIIQGLMTMAPWFDNPELARPIFKSLAELRTVLRAEVPGVDWQHLSMGMTDDFEVAIEEGATIIRVGRAIFGERN